MKWSEVLSRWENGGVLTYPKGIKKRFRWETSGIYNNKDTEFLEKFILVDDLPSVQDYSAFSSYLKEKNVVHFRNLTGEAIMVVPMPMKGRNYVTIKDFIDNAPLSQQRAVWKRVAGVAKSMLKNHNRIWIYTHGYGVPYLHIRVSTIPKYYVIKEFT